MCKDCRGGTKPATLHLVNYWIIVCIGNETIDKLLEWIRNQPIHSNNLLDKTSNKWHARPLCRRIWNFVDKGKGKSK